MKIAKYGWYLHGITTWEGRKKRSIRHQTESFVSNVSRLAKSLALENMKYLLFGIHVRTVMGHLIAD